MSSYDIWDNGWPSGGNYWSDYTGGDVMKGKNQDKPGSDGIGDTPYIINAYNQDRYPLMKPYKLKLIRICTFYSFSQGIYISPIMFQIPCL